MFCEMNCFPGRIFVTRFFFFLVNLYSLLPSFAPWTRLYCWGLIWWRGRLLPCLPPTFISMESWSERLATEKYVRLICRSPPIHTSSLNSKVNSNDFWKIIKIYLCLLSRFLLIIVLFNFHIFGCITSDYFWQYMETWESHPERGRRK